MNYVLSVIHPPVPPAAFGKAETIGPFTEKLKAVQRITYIVAVKHRMPGNPAAAFAKVLWDESDGSERMEPMTGLTFRIDPADDAPHPCPCGEDDDNPCRRLVLPDDHAYADAEDAYCPGCFTWNRGDVACLPANTAHTEEP